MLPAADGSVRGKTRTAVRLLAGALRAPWRRVGLGQAARDILEQTESLPKPAAGSDLGAGKASPVALASFDCFETLVHRDRPDWERQAVFHLGRSVLGHRFDEALAAAKAGLAAEISGDPELGSEETWRRFSRHFGCDEEIGTRISRIELRALTRTCSPHPEAAELLGRLRAAAVRTVVASDTRWGADDLKTLLSGLGLELPAGDVFSSCSIRAGKFRGNLHEAIRADHLEGRRFHAGDMFLADAASSAASGSRALWTTRCAPGSDSASANAYRIGFSVFGPACSLMAAVLSSLPERSRGTLAFAARDGWLPLRALERFERAAGNSGPECPYLRIQRSKARLACIRTPGDLRQQAASVSEVKAGPLGTAQILRWLDLGDAFPDGIPLACEPEELVEWLCSDGFGTVEAMAREARGFLADALSGIETVADVGWGGSIGKLLDRTGIRGPKWRFFARWSTAGRKILRVGDEGIFSDQERDGFSFSAPRELFALVEAFFKEPEEISKENPAAANTLIAIQDGILDAVEACGLFMLLRGGPEGFGRSELEAFRRSALSPMFRFAFFADRGDIEALSSVTLRENHSDWSEPISGGSPVSPWFSPKAWLKGFFCPWRGGWGGRSFGRAGQIFWLAASWILWRHPTLLNGIRTVFESRKPFATTSSAASNGTVTR